MAATPEIMTTAGKLPSRLPLVVFVAAIGLLAWRIRYGIDLSDESYYAIFLDEWMKEGIAATPFLVLHQTAALLTYPFALAYCALVGSTAGLMLALRCLFLVASALSALMVVRFLREVWPNPSRWLVGACVVAFVPYNLPAPSYNTTGMQAVLVACATFGCAVLADQRGQRWLPWLGGSAAAWAVAVMAYPPLLVPLFAFGISILLLRPSRRFLGTYGLLVGAGQVLTWATILGVFGLQRIANSVTYQAGLAATVHPQTILAQVAQLLASNRWSAAVFLLALVVGGLRRRISPWVGAAADAVLPTTLLVIPPALFHVSHSIVLAAALGGLAIIADLRRQANAETRLLAILYLTSWIVGVAMMAGTASLVPYKVPLGALLAACIAVAVTGKRWSEAGHPRLAVVPAASLWVVLAVSMFDAYYGELPQYVPEARYRIEQGPFAGLWAAPDDAHVLSVAREGLRRHERPGDTLAVLGRFPGLHLESKAPVRALQPYVFSPFVRASAVRTTHDYYAALERRPSLVLVHYDPDLIIVNPFAPDFDAWYALQTKLPTPRGYLEVFRRRDQVP